MRTLAKHGLAILLVVAGLAAFAAEPGVQEAIRAEIEQLRETGHLSVDGFEVASGELLARIYENRNFEPAWPDVERTDELIRLVESTAEDGLDPADYHLEALRRVRAKLAAGERLDATERAAIDMGMTDSLIRIGYHRRFGKVNPNDLDPDWNFQRELRRRDPAVVFQEAMDADSLAGYLERTFPRDELYGRMQAYLLHYRELAAAGGWPPIPRGPTLRPGDSDERLPLLAQRLAITGELPAGAVADPAVYGGALEAAVRDFQARHGLEVDGVVGAATLRALNVPVERRIEQIRVNLERSRWVLDSLADDFVIVNIAGFRVYVFRDHEMIWSSRAVVGRTYRKTPVFRSEMRYVVFNPDWTVPYSIATRDILPAVQNDPGYLATGNYLVKDSNGDTVDPAGIDWASLNQRNFPYTLVQQPGAGNALGEIKFMFPNEHAVYLHDTPAKGLFDRADRTFSSGCVRVEYPFEFAALLLEANGLDAAAIEKLRQSRETKTVFLEQPVPVLLLYWTAEVGRDGRIRFYDDVYDRDRAVLEALNSPYRVELP
ncbi:MAG TPA: L,D-transpeptidase family protein [Woeseiaceae bacterium]|nr:L,D-transpeptidase family protein [Woeseiaceae bacterium]